MDATETHPAAAAAEPQDHAAIERGPRVLPLRQADARLEEQGVPIGYEALRTMADRERIATVKRDGKRHVEMRALRSLASARRSDMPPSAASAETRGMIAERSESTLTEELHAARTQITALEEQLQQRRSWFSRRRTGGMRVGARP